MSEKTIGLKTDSSWLEEEGSSIEDATGIYGKLVDYSLDRARVLQHQILARELLYNIGYVRRDYVNIKQRKQIIILSHIDSYYEHIDEEQQDN